MLQTRHAVQPACRTRGRASRRPTHETLEQLEAQMRCGVSTDIESCRQIGQRRVKSAGMPIDQFVLRRTQIAYQLEAGRSPQGPWPPLRECTGLNRCGRLQGRRCLKRYRRQAELPATRAMPPEDAAL